MGKKGRSEISGFITVLIMGIILIIIIPLFNSLIKSVSQGTIEYALNGIIEAFIPLIAIAIFLSL